MLFSPKSSDCTSSHRAWRNNGQRFNIQHLDSSFSLKQTVFTLSSSSRLHKSSSTSGASVILYTFVPLYVKLQVAPPQKELRTEITFVILYPFVLYFTISSCVVSSEHFLASYCSAWDFLLSRMKCQVCVVLLLQSELLATFLTNKHSLTMFGANVASH